MAFWRWRVRTAVTGFPCFLNETAKSMSAESLIIALADCVKLRALSRERNDYIAVCMFDVAINHINAEILRRDAKNVSL